MKTARLFNLLDLNGPMCTKDLATAAGLPSRHVWGLLKGPTRRGRVTRCDGLWAINRDAAYATVKRVIWWTKCTDALPDDEESVLLACDDGEVQVGHHEDDRWRWLDGRPICGVTVTHWAPLPNHPDDD